MPKVVFGCGSTEKFYKVRPEVANFAVEMEREMQKKDALGYTHADKSLRYLVDKLIEERCEADTELCKGNNNNIRNELIHEAIIVMLVHSRFSE